jgi:hypothetical protein
MFGKRKRTLLLGLVFVIFLVLSYVENTLFFEISSMLLQNQVLAVGVIFLHNVIVVSLALLGMTFYVDLVVSDFFNEQKYEYTVLNHPRIFAMLFTAVVLFLSILRGSIIFFGGINFEILPLILLVSAPIGIIEGYGMYLTISRTLSRTMSMKWLAHIYSVFFIAAVIEVVFMNLLT